MEQSKVYFTTFKATEHENLLQKLHRLMKTAGFEQIDFTDKYAAIKIHFGEYGNLAFLRPNYAKVVADYVKELGGKPFLTDCNTLYVGSRKNALDHLDTAYVNGFSPLQTGCHVLIADGLKGTDETLVPLNGEYVKEAKIGHAIMDADGDFYAVAAGHWHEAWLEGTRIVTKQQGVKAKAKADIAISSGGGFPRDMNLYQGMKAYVPAAMALKEGGVIIAVLECEDIAEPPVFFNCFHYDDLKQMEQDVRDGFSIPFYVAFYTCCLAERFTIILVTRPENFEKARKTRAVPVATLKEAMAMAEKIVGREDYTVNIIPHGMATIPFFD